MHCSRQPEWRFGKHYCQPMTEQEFDELCDLIAQMILGKMKKDAAMEASSRSATKREQDGQAHSE
jgi:hypothetical protein